MIIKELKEQIENKTITQQFRIFKLSDNNWLAKQYITEIASILGCKLEYYNEIPHIKRDIFGFDLVDPVIRVVELTKLTTPVTPDPNIIIMTSSIDKEIENTLSEYVIEIPELVDWQVEDYVGGMLTGLSDENIHKLCQICGYEIYRVDQEINRLKIFNENERNIIFNQLEADGAFGFAFDQNMIFTFCDAIMRKDRLTVRNIYNMIIYQDIEPLGVVTILIKKFRQLCDLQLNPQPTAQSCGMSDKQFWYLRKNATGIYTNAQVIRNLKLLNDLDKRLKAGTLGFNASQTLTDHQFIDYIVTHVMCN